MNRQQAKELLPIIQAFAEGKTIQVKGPDNRWYDYKNKTCKLNFNSDPQSYCIKPEPKYRPFANADECWQEMQKHQPFGWIRNFWISKQMLNLPKGSIKKLIGRELNWNDEPVELKSE